jgi:ribosomal protein L37AE/L43A
MRISHLQAIADILLGDAKTLARGYHEIMTDNGADFETADARRRCAIAVNAVGMAVATDGYRSALNALEARPRVEPKCHRCGSTELVRDASAEWDCATQQWGLSGVYDCTICQACEAESDSLCDWQPCAPNTVQPPLADTTAAPRDPQAPQ